MPSPVGNGPNSNSGVGQSGSSGPPASTPGAAVATTKSSSSNFAPATVTVSPEYTFSTGNLISAGAQSTGSGGGDYAGYTWQYEKPAAEETAGDPEEKPEEKSGHLSLFASDKMREGLGPGLMQRQSLQSYVNWQQADPNIPLLGMLYDQPEPLGKPEDETPSHPAEKEPESKPSEDSSHYQTGWEKTSEKDNSLDMAA